MHQCRHIICYLNGEVRFDGGALGRKSVIWKCYIKWMYRNHLIFYDLERRGDDLWLVFISGTELAERCLVQ